VLVHFVIFLPLHAAVLEPDLDLPLSESDEARDLEATTTTHVVAEVKFLFELQSLLTSVRCSRPPAAWL